MKAIFRSSITRKLMVANVVVSGVVLLLAGLVFGAYDRTTFRQGVIRNLSTQAQIVAANSVSALLFNDPAAADQTLSALSARPNIVSAEIYTQNGNVFATYQRDGSASDHELLAIPYGEIEAQRMDTESITLARRIELAGKQAGTIAIHSDLGELTTRRAQYSRILAGVLIASLIVALFISWASQRAISKPIVHLADVARRVSGHRDYGVRATGRAGSDEISVLTNAFNDMLSQIQQRDASLLKAANELEERVQQRTAELDAVNTELEAFSYSVSHDLRAPLRHVAGFAGLLEEHTEGQLDDQGRKYLKTISDAAKRMGQLIDDLLAFSRMGRGKLSTRKVDLNELLRDARQEVTAQSGAESRINWRVDNLPEVDADPAMLRLAVTNLLSNAVKYSSTRPESHIEVGTKGVDKGETVVFVRDNGVGFDMKYADKLFGVFQRLHRAEEFEGTGIGLANVRRIVHRHGGRVWAEGAVDHGATFYFTLPMKVSQP